MFEGVHGMEWKKQVKRAMVDRGTNAARLSLCMGKSNNYITNILNKGTSPTLDTLQAIADALGYDLAISLIDRQTGKRIDA